MLFAPVSHRGKLAILATLSLLLAFVLAAASAAQYMRGNDPLWAEYGAGIVAFALSLFALTLIVRRSLLAWRPLFLPSLGRNAHRVAWQIGAIALITSVGVVVGGHLVAMVGSQNPNRLSRVLVDSAWLQELLFLAVPLLVIAVNLRQLRELCESANAANLVVLASLTGIVMALANPAQATFLYQSGLPLPIWIIQAAGAGLTVWIVVAKCTRDSRATLQIRRVSLDSALAGRSLSDEYDRLDEVTDGRQSLTRDRDASRARMRLDPRWRNDHALFSRGVTGSARVNIAYAATIGLTLGVLPTVYFSSALILDEFSQTDVSSLTILAFGTATELARWVVPALLFGALYNWLPGRIGIVKAAWLSAMWIPGAALALAVSISLGAEFSMQQVYYRGLQLLVLLTSVAIILDFQAVRRVGGSWRTFRKLYPLNTFAEISASTIPLLLAAIALAQQIAAGTGLDVAASFLEGVAAIPTSSIP
ncbi:hypothetical protein [Angustibacter speluncae]